MSQNSRDDHLAHESDPRFPSTDYAGHYIQWGHKFKMTLNLIFRADRFEGLGIDPVGTFEVKGTYDVDTGHVSFLKHYQGRHAVDYVGYAEAVDHGIWGTWTIGQVLDRGGWHIWPRRHRDAQARHEHEDQSEPMSNVQPVNHHQNL
jgi:hypothetical protein